MICSEINFRYVDKRVPAVVASRGYETGSNFAPSVRRRRVSVEGIAKTERYVVADSRVVDGWGEILKFRRIKIGTVDWKEGSWQN